MSTNPSRLDDVLPKIAYRTGHKGEKIKGRRKELVVWLRSKRRRLPSQCQALADKLDACRPRSRCGSGACPECAKAAQRHFSRTLRRFLKKDETPGEVVCVSVIPIDGRVWPRKLKKAGLQRAVRRWREKLATTTAPYFIGGIDISANEHDQDRYPRHWSLHVWGVAKAKDPRKFKKELKTLFAKDDTTPRPVKVKPWDGRSNALRYVLKGEFKRRIGTDKQSKQMPDGTTRTCRGTREDRLRSRHREELLLFLDEVGFQGRLVMRSAQFSGSMSGKAKIVLRPPTPPSRKPKDLKKKSSYTRRDPFNRLFLRI